jgi:hypothetical protein
MTTRLRFGIFPKVLLTMIGVAVILVHQLCVRDGPPLRPGRPAARGGARTRS